MYRHLDSDGSHCCHNDQHDAELCALETTGPQCDLTRVGGDDGVVVWGYCPDCKQLHNHDNRRCEGLLRVRIPSIAEAFQRVE